jgi:hypothetical protein
MSIRLGVSEQRIGSGAQEAAMKSPFTSVRHVSEFLQRGHARGVANVAPDPLGAVLSERRARRSADSRTPGRAGAARTGDRWARRRRVRPWLARTSPRTTAPSSRRSRRASAPPSSGRPLRSTASCSRSTGTSAAPSSNGRTRRGGAPGSSSGWPTTSRRRSRGCPVSRERTCTGCASSTSHTLRRPRRAPYRTRRPKLSHSLCDNWRPPSPRPWPTCPGGTT